MAPSDFSGLDTIEKRVRRLVLVCVVPAWAAASMIVLATYQYERDDQIRATVRQARVLMQQVEQELALQVGLLQTLATSGSIDDRDLPRFHRQATEVQLNASADNIVWFDSPLHVVVSAAHPLNAALPPSTKDRFPGLFEHGRPAVSDLFVGQVSKKPQIAVAVPILRARGVVGRLDMVITPARFSQLLDLQGISPTWTVALVDRQGVIVARNRDPQRFVGSNASPALLSELQGDANEGHFEGRTAEGTDSVGCFARSKTYGWMTAIGVPVSELRAILLARLGLLALMAALVALTGLLLARRLAGRIAAPVQALVAPALDIGRGIAAALPASTLKETAEVSDALRQAQDLLLQREQSRRLAESALEDSQSRLAMALDVSRIGTWELDPHSQIVTRSRRLEECFGHADVPRRWTLDDFIDHLHPADRQRMAHDIQLLQDHPEHRSDRTECRVRWPDDSEHWIAWCAARIDDPGQRSRVVGIVIDITQEKQAEQIRLEQARIEAERRQLQESNRLKSEFLANMSHEMRTPLNAIIGFADLLRSAALPPDSPKRDTYLSHITSAGRHLLTLINDVLDLAKVEAGKFDFHPEPTDVGVIAREAIDLLEAQAASRRIAIDLDHDPSIDGVVLDPSRLKQVLFNFLSNAIKFTPVGGQVWLRSRAEGSEHFRIEVQDTGPGISAVDQKLLFTQFQQLDAGRSKQHRGTGLGLALTRQLVEGQGGRVGVNSTVGAGSTFFLVMPRRPAAQGASAREAACPPVA